MRMEYGIWRTEDEGNVEINKLAKIYSQIALILTRSGFLVLQCIRSSFAVLECLTLAQPSLHLSHVFIHDAYQS